MSGPLTVMRKLLQRDAINTSVGEYLAKEKKRLEAELADINAMIEEVADCHRGNGRVAKVAKDVKSKGPLNDRPLWAFICDAFRHAENVPMTTRDVTKHVQLMGYKSRAIDPASVVYDCLKSHKQFVCSDSGFWTLHETNI